MSRLNLDNGESITRGFQSGIALARAYQDSSDRAKEQEMDDKVGEALNRQTEVITTEGKDGAPSTTQYKHGGLTRDTDFTPEEVKAANRQEARDALGSYGSKGAARIAQMDNQDTAALGLKAAQRVDKEADRTEVFKTKVLKPLTDELGKLEEGSPEYATQQKLIQSAIASHDYEKGRANKLAELGVSEKEFEKMRRENEKTILEGTKSPEALGEMLTNKYHDGKTYEVKVGKTGGVSVVQLGSDGVPKIVQTANSFEDLQMHIRQEIPRYAEIGTMENIAAKVAKQKHADEMELQREKNKGLVARSPSAAKYGSAIDSHGTVYSKVGKDWVDTDGNIYNSAGGNRLEYLGSDREFAQISPDKQQLAVGAFIDNWKASRTKEQKIKDRDDKTELNAAVAEFKATMEPPKKGTEDVTAKVQKNVETPESIRAEYQSGKISKEAAKARIEALNK